MILANFLDERRKHQFSESSQEFCTHPCLQIFHPLWSRVGIAGSERPSALVAGDAQHGQKSLLGNVHFADSLHAALAFLLLLQQLSFTRNVAAVTLDRKS